MTFSPVSPVVERAVEDEPHERFEIELVRRHPEHDARRRGGGITDRAGMAQRAIEADLIDPEPAAARDADGQVVPGSTIIPTDASPPGSLSLQI